MKKNILKTAMIVAFAVVASCNVFSSKSQVDQLLNTTLVDIEALAGCEVSSNPDKNIGICVSDIDEVHEYCAKKNTVWGSSPACSGTI